MRGKIMRWKILYVLLPLLSAPVAADVISLRSDEFCPFNCAPEAEQPGFMIEFAQAIFSQAGHTIDYQLMPWSRAIADTMDGQYDGLVGTVKIPGLIYPEQEQGMNINVFWVKPGTPWRYTGMESLAQASIGVIRDYKFGDEFDAYLEKYQDDSKRIQIVSGETALQQNIKKAVAGRITAYLDDRAVLRYHLEETKQAGLIEEAGKLNQIPLYIGFSAKRPNSARYAQLLSTGMEELRKTGKLQEIMRKYGLQDWQEPKQAR
jgi:polar amino acid transport system substrate-binding protein